MFWTVFMSARMALSSSPRSRSRNMTASVNRQAMPRFSLRYMLVWTKISDSTQSR
jgi:hypothetical protein